MTTDRLPAVTLRRAAQADIAGLAAFNAQVHGAGIGVLAERLCAAPHCTPSDFWVACDPRGSIVSSLVLMPGVLEIGTTPVPYAEVGLVGTAERWRGLGVCSALIRKAHADLCARGIPLAMLLGIRDYYARFGYVYTVPAGLYATLALDAAGTASPPYHLRPAGLGDVAQLTAWYRDLAGRRDVRGARRDEAATRYLLAGLGGSATASSFYLLSDAAGPVGYVRVADESEDGGLYINEASDLSPAAAHALLGLLAELARRRGRPHLRFNLAADHPLRTVALELGASPTSTYAWQVALLQPRALLHTLRAEFTRRLDGWPVDLELNLCGEGVCLRGGPTVTIGAAGQTAPTATATAAAGHLAQLCLGSHTFADLAAAGADVDADDKGREALALLFPRLIGWIDPLY
ncbi:MAG TPA: hypothetical protein DCZ72_02985 [Armatimonadetes bacterium]|nr:hypothetical protein [Armatimonadota bacterium]